MNKLQNLVKIYLEICLIAALAVIVFSITTALGIKVTDTEETSQQEKTNNDPIKAQKESSPAPQKNKVA